MTSDEPTPQPGQQTTNAPPTPPDQRTKEYIGRDPYKRTLYERTRAVVETHPARHDRAAPRCRALYIQAPGGYGKTRLLEEYAAIIREHDPRLADRIKVARLIDLFGPGSHQPLTLEQRLIAGLTHDPSDPSSDSAHSLPEKEVTAAFADYQNQRKVFLHTPDISRASRRQQEDALHQAFIKGWNRLAATIPLVMRLDTVEGLFAAAAAPDAALVQAPAAEPPTNIDAPTPSLLPLIHWFQTVLPHLRHTLVLLCGRPVARNHLVLTLHTEKVLGDDDLLELPPFDPAEARKYLDAYGLTEIDTQLSHALELTGGLPLLLACYAALVRTHPRWWQQAKAQVASLQDFRALLAPTLLDPEAVFHITKKDGTVEVFEHTDDDRALAYGLCILSYARRGIGRHGLHRLASHLGLALSKTVLERLDNHVMVKRLYQWEPDPLDDDLTPTRVRYTLNDEIWLMLDMPGLPEQRTLREPVLSYLLERTRARVAALRGKGLPAQLLAAMADHLYYALTWEVDSGYRTYLVYADRLLRQGQDEAALLLAEAFWTVLEVEVPWRGTVRQPYRDALDQSQILSYEAVLRGELVRRVRLFLGQERYDEALRLALALYQRFRLAKGPEVAVAGVDPLDTLPANGRLLEEGAAEDLSLQVVSTLALARVLTRIDAWCYAPTILAVLDPVVERLRTAATLNEALRATRYHTTIRDDDMLRLRRPFLLGEAYLILGDVQRILQHYPEAISAYEEGRDALLDYRERTIDPQVSANQHESISAERFLNDDATAELARIITYLAPSLAERGDFIAARRRADEVVARYLDWVTPDGQTLFHATRAFIALRQGDLPLVVAALRQAEQTAQVAPSARTRGQVLRARVRLLHAWLTARRLDELPAAALAPVADFFAEDQRKRPASALTTDEFILSLSEFRELFERDITQAETLLHQEQDALRGLYEDHARFLRDLGSCYAEDRHERDPDQARVCWEQALTWLAQILPPQDQARLATQQANLLEGEAALHNNLGEYAAGRERLERAKELLSTPERQPEYVQMVCGKLALQQAFLAIHEPEEPDPREVLRWMAKALARTAIYALEHRDAQTIRAVARRFLRQLLMRCQELTSDELSRLLDEPSFTVGVAELKYQRPEERRWQDAWRLALERLHQILDALSRDEGT